MSGCRNGAAASGCIDSIAWMYAVTISRVVMRVRVPRSAFRCRPCALCSAGSSRVRVTAGRYPRTPILLGAIAIAGCGRIGAPPLRDADTRVVDGSLDIPVDALAGPPADACTFGAGTVSAGQPFGMVNGPQNDWGVEISDRKSVV